MTTKTAIEHLSAWMDGTEYQRAVVDLARQTIDFEHTDPEFPGYGEIGGKVVSKTREICEAHPENIAVLFKDLRNMIDAICEVEAQLPLEFWMENKHVYTVGSDGFTPVSSQLRVLAETRDARTRENGIAAEVWDKHDGWREVILPQDALFGEGEKWAKPLARAGLKIDSTLELKKLLHSATTTDLILTVDQPGWQEIHGKPVYVLPDGIIGDGSGATVRFAGDRKNFKLAQSGTLEEWQNTVASLAVGNSRLEFALFAAFAPVLLQPLRIADISGFHFWGKSSKGKTSTLQVAASVYGKGCDKTGFIKTWRSTDNAMENIAYRHNDMLLPLDESHLAKKLGDSIYTIGSGQNKSRMKSSSEERDDKQWRTMPLSTGEKDIPDIIRDDGGEVTGGQMVRLVGVPAIVSDRLGVFENLHGRKKPVSFSKDVKTAAMTHYGTAGAAFIEYAVTHYQEIVGRKDEIEQTARSFVPENADGQVERVAELFALVAFAGELAIEADVLPWATGHAKRISKRLFTEWLKARGGIESNEALLGVRNVLEYMRTHGASRFQAPEMEVVHNRAGFYDDQQHAFIWFEETFKKVCGNCAPDDVIKQLDKVGLIIRGDSNRLKRRNRLTSDSKRYLHIKLPDKDEGELHSYAAALSEWAAQFKPEDFEVKDGDEPDVDVDPYEAWVQEFAA